jgi:WD40 repeat protein
MKSFCSASHDFTAKVWDSESVTEDLSLKTIRKGPPAKKTNKVAEEVTKHSSPVKKVLYFPEGDKMLSMSEDGELFVWNAETNKLMNRTTTNTGSMRICAVSNDSKYVVVGGDTVTPLVYRTDVLSDPIATFTGHTHFFQACAISPDSELCITSQLFDVYSIFAWKLKTGELVKDLKSLGHSNLATINMLEFSKDGAYFVTVGREGKIVLWDRAKFIPIQVVEAHITAINVCRLFGDPPHILALSEDHTCSVRLAANLQSATVIFTGHDAPVTAGDIDSTQTIAVTASSDGTVLVWNLNDGRILGHLKGHTSPAASIVFFPNSKVVVTTSTDKTIRVWNTEKAEQIAIFPTLSFCPSLSVCPRGTKIFAGDSAGHVYMLSCHQV